MKRIASWGFVFLLGLACAVPAQSPQWKELNEAGERAYRQGRYAEAEKFFLGALKRAQTLGREHPAVATSLNNLAALYYNQGKYAEAEPLYRRSLAIMETVEPPMEPDGMPPEIVMTIIFVVVFTALYFSRRTLPEPIVLQTVPSSRVELFRLLLRRLLGLFDWRKAAILLIVFGGGLGLLSVLFGNVEKLGESKQRVLGIAMGGAVAVAFLLFAVAGMYSVVVLLRRKFSKEKPTAVKK